MVRRLHTIAVALFLVIACAPCFTVARRAKAAKATLPHEENPLIRSVTQANFREITLDPNVPVVMVMYDADNSKVSETISKAIDEVSKELIDVVEFAALDGSKADGKALLQSFGVGQLPAIMLFNPELVPVPGGQEGQLMKAPVGYEGDASPLSLIKFILNSISTNHIERVSDDHDLADFFSKFSGLDLPRFLYFTEQRGSISPLFVSLTHRFRYGGVFGVAFANSSAEVQKRYRVTNFPTLLALVPSGSDGDEVTVMPNLSKDTSVDELKAFMERFALPFERQAVIRPSIYLEEEKLRQKEADHAKMVKALPPQLITTKKEWVHQCLTRKKGNCLAVFVESVAEDQIPYEMLFNVSRKIATKSSVPLQIVIVDGLHNYEMTAHFGIVNGLPDAIFFNPAKRLYMNLIGSLTERGLTNFYLDKALKSPGKPFKAKKVPKFVKTPRQVDEDEISDEL